MQSPMNASALTPDQFTHVKQEPDRSGRGRAGQRHTEPQRHHDEGSGRPKRARRRQHRGAEQRARELALAKLEAAIRDRKLAKSKTAAHHTKANGALPMSSICFATHCVCKLCIGLSEANEAITCLSLRRCAGAPAATGTAGGAATVGRRRQRRRRSDPRAAPGRPSRALQARHLDMGHR